MRAIETPIQKCFSSNDMEGAYYHEYNESNKHPHTIHRYDKEGKYIVGSTKNSEIKFHTDKGKEYITVSKYKEMLENHKKKSKQ